LFSSCQGQIFLSSPSGPDQLWGSTQLPIQWVFPQEIKWPEHEVDHSLPYNTEVKNTWGSSIAVSTNCSFIALSLVYGHWQTLGPWMIA
jgi:hypothetical protein